MIIIWGRRFYGRVQEIGPTAIATRFAHVYYVPLLPIETHLILETLSDGRFRSIELPLNGKSVFCGYARVWGPLLAIAGLLGLAAAWPDLGSALFAAFIAAAGIGAAYVGFFHAGKLTPLEYRQRMVYWYQLGYPVDPAELGPAREGFRAQLAAKIAAATEGAVESGYRSKTDAALGWPRVALDPSHKDPNLVGAALTLARLDESLAPESDRPALRQLHGELWARLEAEGWAPPAE